MLQYDLRISYINLSILRTPTRICHCPFAMLLCLRHIFPQLFNLWQTKIILSSVIDVERETIFKTSEWHVVQHLSHIPLLRYLLNTSPNMSQIQNWHQLIGDPTLRFLDIVISMNHIMEYLRSTALRQAQYISNSIYLVSYLLSMIIILLNMNL